MKWKTNCIRIFGILVLTNNPLLLLQIFRTKQHETRLIFFMLPNSKRNIFLRDSSNVFKNFQQIHRTSCSKIPFADFIKFFIWLSDLSPHNPTPPLFAEREFNRLNRLQQTSMFQALSVGGDERIAGVQHLVVVKANGSDTFSPACYSAFLHWPREPGIGNTRPVIDGSRVAERCTKPLLE